MLYWLSLYSHKIEYVQEIYVCDDAAVTAKKYEFPYKEGYYTTDKAYLGRKLPVKDIVDRKVCHSSVKRVGTSLKSVPEEFVDYNICLSAVKSDGNALQHVPERYKTEEICIEAVKNNEYGSHHLPEIFQTERMYLKAVAKEHGVDPNFFRGLLQDKLTKRVFLVAVLYASLGDFLDEVMDFIRRKYNQYYAECQNILVRYEKYPMEIYKQYMEV